MKNLLLLMAIGLYGVPMLGFETQPAYMFDDGQDSNFSIDCWTETVQGSIAVVCANDGHNYMYVDPPKLDDSVPSVE
jgi:hypothetical protein